MEVTSTSNCTTFQARRLGIRERTERGTRPVATLNGTLGHDPLDRGAAGEPPAARRLGARAQGAAAVPRRPRPARAGRVRSSGWRPKLVALDVDGTLLTYADFYAPPRRVVRRAVRRARDAGAHVVVATGRSLHSTVPVIDQLELDHGYAVCSNGAVVADVETRTPGARDHVRRERPRAILRRGDSRCGAGGRGARCRIPRDRRLPGG